MQDVSRDPITFAELLARPGVEETVELRSSFGFCAFHGGNLERMTAEIATEAARRAKASIYTVVQPSGMRQHIPSAQVSPAQSEALNSFIDHCEFVVALHGFGRRKMFTSLLFGGRNRELATHVAYHVRAALPAYQTIDNIDDIPRELRGLHPDNPCNLTSGGGVQIELPPRVRGLSPLALFWPSHDHKVRRFPHANYLIDGLVDAAVSWPG